MTAHYFFTIAILVISFATVFYLIYCARNKHTTAFKEPFVTRPRPAGHSLQKRTENLFLDLTFSLFLLTLLAITPLTAHDKPSIKWIISALSIIGIIIIIIKTLKISKRYGAHLLGLKGEQLVGITLDRLSTDQVKIFHDYYVHEKGKKPWNIDHIIVAPTGIFAIETKTRSKKHYHDDKKGHQVTHEDGTLTYPYAVDTYGIDQAKRQATHLAKELTGSTGSPLNVIPVLALPGWYVINKSKDFNVMNEKGLQYLLQGPEIISPQVRQQVTHQLEKVCIV
ncbi:MAG: nuclease-related domain-containing protein [Akkermansiaceae bacterium]